MTFKKAMKKFGRMTWTLVKMSFPSMFMYAALSLIVVMLTMGESLSFSGGKATWWAVCLAGAIAYNALMAYMQGSMGFEMLVSGNMKRMSMEDFEGGYRISSHKEAQEYRAWKGFVVGGILAILPIITGIVFGCNQSLIDSVFADGATQSNAGFGWTFLILLMLSGWSTTLFLLINTTGVTISYFVCIAFAVLPILINGFMYIAGAYGKRRKTLKAQELADRVAQEQSTTTPKINYGGLPGTKPRKRR